MRLYSDLKGRCGFGGYNGARNADRTRQVYGQSSLNFYLIHTEF